MGQYVMNTYAGVVHAEPDPSATPPFQYEVDNGLDADTFGVSWGDEGISESANGLTTQQKADLKSAAQVDQDTFDDEAALVAIWYSSFTSGLTNDEATMFRALCRYAWKQT